MYTHDEDDVVTAVDVLDDADALQAVFTQQLMIDARETFRDMQSPAVLRIRAEMDDPVTYRILSMRLANMGSARETLRTRLVKVLDGELQLNQPVQREGLYRDVQRAIDACRRVLESTDKEHFVSLVVENAEAMSDFIGKMSALLSARFPEFAHRLANASMQATKTAQNAPRIAAEMKAAYEAVRHEIDSAGPRAPIRVSALNPEPQDEPAEAIAPR